MGKFDIENLPTSESGKRMLRRISPVYENSYFMKWVCQATGMEWDEARELVLSLREQIFTETVTWGIEYQEHKYSIEPDESLSLEERRARLKRRTSQKFPLNPGVLEHYIKNAWDITTDVDETYDYGRIKLTFPEELPATVEDMLKDVRRIKPSHLVLFLKLIRELRLDDESKIRIALASLFAGYRHVGLAIPETFTDKLNTSIVPARSGILRIGVGMPDRSDPFNFDVGLGQYLGGKISLGVNADDLPDIFREEASRLAPILGYAYVRRGVHRLPLATPEDVLVPFGFGSSIGKSGKRHYGLAPPDGGVIASILGTATAHNGERRFEHDPDDLPEWFKNILSDSVIQEVIRTADIKTSRNLIGLSPPEQGLVPFATGFYSGLFGVTTVEADQRDLPPEFAERVARAVATIGLSVRQQTRRFISIAAPETAKAAFGVGMLQKRSGTVKVPLASPEDAALEQGLGTAAFKNGCRTLFTNPADIPEWFKNILDDAKVAESIITALYTRGRKKASLASVDDARLEAKVGMGGAENGRRSVDIDPDDLPEMFKNILDDARVVAQLGIMLKQAGKRSVGLAPVAEPEATSVKTGLAANISGEVAIRADPDDLPDEYKMPEPRAVIMAGVEILEKVWRRIHLEPPEESRAAYSLAITDFTGGRRTILPSMPDDSKADMGVGFADSFGGRRDIGADLDDLPEAFKERSTRLNPLFGVATTHRGNRRVGLAMMLKDSSTTYAGTVGAITGYKVIGADLNDLEPPRRRRILPHAGLVHAGTMAVG